MTAWSELKVKATLTPASEILEHLPSPIFPHIFFFLFFLLENHSPVHRLYFDIAKGRAR